MPYVNSKEVIKDAQENNYAVGAFNVYNIEDSTAVISAAEEVNSPVILMTSGAAVEHTGVEEFAGFVSTRAEQASIPVCLHLDHANDFDRIMEGIFAGYTSVMYDGSMLNYDENVKKTREVVRVARIFDVNVEAEIGVVGRGEDGLDDREMVLSDPAQVKSFCEETGIDTCAIAIGTQHAMQTKEANIDFQRLKEISDKVDTPLVLHGSSGVKHEDLNRVSQGYIQKINIGTRLKRVFTDTLREKLATEKDVHNHITYLNYAMDAVKEEVITKLEAMNNIDRT